MELFLIGATIILGTWFLFSFLPNAFSPQLHRDARAISKRLRVSGTESSTSTRYYVTFEFSDRSRAEFKVGARTYSVLAEGDSGTLHFQGNWFRSFNRQLP